jgi:hypothetical protein
MVSDKPVSSGTISIILGTLQPGKIVLLKEQAIRGTNNDLWTFLCNDCDIDGGHVRFDVSEHLFAQPYFLV